MYAQMVIIARVVAIIFANFVNFLDSPSDYTQSERQIQRGPTTDMNLPH